MSDDAPICRYVIGGIKTDVMPTDPAILGFANKWAQRALTHAKACQLPGGDTIRVVTRPYFIATKLEAFLGRGNGDYLASHDIEDIISIIDGCETIVVEIATAEESVRDFIASELRSHAASLTNVVGAHLPPDAASQARASTVRTRVEAMRKG